MTANEAAKPLKSRLFLIFADNSESEGSKKFARHLNELLRGLDEPTRKTCLATLSDMRNVRTSAEKNRLLDSLSASDPGQRAVIEHSLSVLSFLVDALSSDKFPADDHVHWADDLETFGWLNSDSRPIFESLLEELTKDHLSELQAQDRRRRAEGGVLPVFSKLGITVEARAVWKERYKWGMPLEGDGAYNPEMVGTAMIASVHIGVDEGFPEDFYFQMDEEDIDAIVSSLVAAKKEMIAIRQYLKLDAEGKVVANS